MKLAYTLLVTTTNQLSTSNKITVTKLSWTHKLVGNKLNTMKYQMQ